MASFAQTTNASFDISQMTSLLEHDNRETRSALKELFKDPLFTPRYALTLPEERELALARLKALCENKSISVRDLSTTHTVSSQFRDGRNDGQQRRNQMTVQFNLFGGPFLNWERSTTMMDSLTRLIL